MDISDTLIKDYTAEQLINFDSEEFEAILDTLNSVLEKHKIEPLSYDSARIKKSLYDKGELANKSLWRVTSIMYPELNNYQLVEDLKKAINEAFPDYVANKTIMIGWYKDKDDKWQSTIKILPGNLKDNTFTAQDLELYGKDEEVTLRLNALEQRMYRRADDTRSAEQRWDDFKWANIYEPKLCEANLKDIADLKLSHDATVFSIDAPEDPDFIGTVRGEPNCLIEGKSTWDMFRYIDTPAGREAFAKYFANKKLGSLHNSKYVLFIFKITGQVICINKSNYDDSWIAGKIDLISK